MSNVRRRRGPGAIRARAVAVALAAPVALGACALTANAPPEAEAEELRVVRYAVEPGDRLSLIAREFTGDMELWRTIADLNGIDDPRRLAVGQVLEIPAALIPESDREARLASSLPVADDDASAATDNAATRLAALRARTALPAPASGDPVAVDPGAAPAPAPEPGPESLRAAEEPVVVSAVRSRGAFEMSPIDESGAGAAGSRSVKVIGSYTPKGVYAEPAAGSRVLMRITPGTVLPLERSVDGWYRVTTSAGPGFIRAEDARVLGDAAGG